ncbi:PREDICTED: L-amino-acid oxidase-like [Acropora digitifera]|uniref:L-amino-acid oxidase-like n=1 Tax=Acropora digitifera TaxID=70779 RepID=UPI00077A793A|nr:PREDICTED: L-amino-acid oxidase-like [Acropora digitifera]
MGNEVIGRLLIGRILADLTIRGRTEYNKLIEPINNNRGILVEEKDISQKKPGQKLTQKGKRVIVVGAGMAGLVAAYELEQVGHDVIVRESQDRVGGRIDTLHFDRKLLGEAGAMRLPCSPTDKEKTHFLTDFYVSHFDLNSVRFGNSCKEAYLKFYNMKKAVRIKDWDNKKFDELWPGWNDTLIRNQVTDIHDIATKNCVKVMAYDETRTLRTFDGDAVIVTVPINILRQITFSPTVEDTFPPLEFHKAIEGIFTGTATKLFLTTKTRFWEKDGIKGGFSKTNLPIGQIHYQENDGDPEGEKGMLLIYTWKTEALLFGSLDPCLALQEAKEQIATIHPEIREEYEGGKVFAWYNKPSAQGAYALLKPNQFQNVRWLLKPMYNIFFAGEGISFASGWIQGALESGLRAAYQFYIRNERDWSCEE